MLTNRIMPTEVAADLANDLAVQSIAPDTPGPWDVRYLELARLVSTWSKDPSTKVGAVIVSPLNTVLSLGFNGLPRGVLDLPSRLNDRDLKYRMIVHAEVNALSFAERAVRSCTLYTYPFMPCCRCAAEIIQRGIHEVVAPPATAELASRWGSDLALTMQMFKESGVRLRIVRF